MIRRKPQNWFRMLFVWNGSVLPQLLPRLGLLFLLSSVIVFFRGTVYHYKIPLNPTPFTLFGITLAIFLGFRNSASYERFWEGRKLWGALLIDCRSLARQAITLSGYEEKSPEVLRFIHQLIAFAYALKHQLRRTDPTADFDRLLSPELCVHLQNKQFKPVILVKHMAAWVKLARDQGRIEPVVQVAFDENLNKLSEIIGGCERIDTTPIPYSYRVLLHRTVYLYCFLLPFGFVDSLGWLTPVIVTFIAYTFVALEAIADEIENPFGTEPNDLALNAICRTVESSLLEMADRPLPSFREDNRYAID
ncbi:hypothetical protein EXU57_04075 [Segetibacter sp. 3557_3]|uniref:bestrophin family protein n=1 Tax=Segetibacter sp. 3557_3 TaxID=2547429 RepID=UPI00105865E0|nr:bestrophin family ion channel [Segetibacter sp. 3557_3]TDH29252.1 hypothetical protein EXU57_04075 [Segetibacter sp. 3557_3]